MDSTRVDRWLWAVRVAKTRTLATDACRGGHVRVNDRPAKPATVVRVGDTVTIRLHGRDRVLEVRELLDKRVGAPVAEAAYVDHSPPPPPRDLVGPGFIIEPSRGRPTKKDRRELDRFRGV